MDRIIRGDCVEVLERLDPGSVDLVVTSPPYPGQYGNGLAVDEWLVWFDVVVARLRRVMAPGAVLALNVMFKRDGSWFDRRLFEVADLLWSNCMNLVDVYIYGKKNPAPNGALTYHDPPAWEPVFVATMAEDPGGYTFNAYREPYSAKSLRSDGQLHTTRTDEAAPHPEGARQTNLLLLSTSEGDRPRAKGRSFPLGLAERFILQHTNAGDLVLDPFAGVGTTCKAAQKHGRRWVGIEIDEEEAERAREWLEEPYEVSLWQ